jgi:hypothetical protein
MCRVRFFCPFECSSSPLPDLYDCVLHLPLPPEPGLSYREGSFESGPVKRVLYDADADEWRAFVEPRTEIERPRRCWFAECFETCWRPLRAARRIGGMPRGPRPRP